MEPSASDSVSSGKLADALNELAVKAVKNAHRELVKLAKQAVPPSAAAKSVLASLSVSERSRSIYLLRFQAKTAGVIRRNYGSRMGVPDSVW